MAKDTKNKVKSEKKEKKTFFKDFKAELKKVTWPTIKQLAQKTAIVIVIVLLISAIVFALYFAFENGYNFIITESSKMINKDQKTNTTTDENQNTASNETTNNVDENAENTNNEVNNNATEGNVTAE